MVVTVETISQRQLEHPENSQRKVPAKRHPRELAGGELLWSILLKAEAHRRECMPWNLDRLPYGVPQRPLLTMWLMNQADKDELYIAVGHPR